MARLVELMKEVSRQVSLYIENIDIKRYRESVKVTGYVVFEAEKGSVLYIPHACVTSDT